MRGCLDVDPGFDGRRKINYLDLKAQMHAPEI